MEVRTDIIMYLKYVIVRSEGDAKIDDTVFRCRCNTVSYCTQPCFLEGPFMFVTMTNYGICVVLSDGDEAFVAMVSLQVGRAERVFPSWWRSILGGN